MPLFSVIVPVFRAEAYLPQCIDSLIGQSFPDFEILLVEDGSPDRSGEICDAYAIRDSRIRVIHKENGGVISARQAGAEAAVGEYIACVDADDWVSPEYLERFAWCMDAYHPDIAHCGFVEVNHKKAIPQPPDILCGFIDRKRIVDELFPRLISDRDGGDYPAYLCGKVFRRTLFLSMHTRVERTVTVWEDEAVTRPCVYRANSLYILGECLYFYRRNHTSVTQRLSPYDWACPRLVGQHYEANIPTRELDFQEQVYRNVVTHLYDASVSQFFRDEPYREIAEDIRHHLREPYYGNAIEKCRFRRNWKMQLKHFVLKHGVCAFMWLHNRVWRHQRNRLAKESKNFLGRNGL